MLGVTTMVDDGRVRVTRYASNLWYPDGDRIDAFVSVTYLADGERVTVLATDAGETYRVVAGKGRGDVFHKVWGNVGDMLQSYVWMWNAALGLALDVGFGCGSREITVEFSGAKADKADTMAHLAACFASLAASTVAAMCLYDDLIVGPADKLPAPQPQA